MMETDVLIAGGGLSGLALADRLTRAGAAFHLIEAQERFGGRILTATFGGAGFDLGPAWFWPEQPRMAAMARRFALTVFEQHADGDLMFQDASGAVHRGRGYASMEGSLRLAGGMGALIDALSAGISAERLSRGMRLTALTREEGGIVAEAEQAGAAVQIRARRVVLAMAPRVIAERIRFAPSLGEAAMAAMARVPTWMAAQAKLVALYDAPHWREAGLSGDAMSQRGPLVEIHDASPLAGGPYALFGFVGVPAGARAGRSEALKQAALAQLAALFGPAMAAPLDVLTQDWAQEPAIAAPLDHAPLTRHPEYGRPQELRDLWEGGLHLASTETGERFGGYLEGALEAANIAAEALMLGATA